MALRFQVRDLGRGVAALSLQQRQRSDINVSSYNWRGGEIHEALIMAEKVIQSHLTNTGKDGAIYEKVEEEDSFRGSGQQNNEYVAVFALVNS
jgi:hypothetical protein